MIVLVESRAVVDAVEHLALKLLVIVGEQKGGHIEVLPHSVLTLPSRAALIPEQWT